MSRPHTSLQKWFWSVLLSLGLIHMFVFIRIPMDIFLAAVGEHSSELPVILENLALFGLVSLVLLSGLTWLVFLRWRDFAGPALLALALAFWLIDSFSLRSYPQLDGALAELPMDYANLTLECVVFGGLLVLLLRARQKFQTPALIFLAVLSVFNAVSTFSTLVAAAPGRDRSGHAITSGELFTFSDRKNLLVILMDTFQSDYLQQMLDQDPALSEGLPGFRYYPDTLGTAPSTFMSLPAIHSGRLYDPGQTMSGYFEDAIGTRSVLSRLADRGYQVSLLNPIKHLCPQGVACVGRDQLLSDELETGFREALYLLDISLMRSAPELLKNRVLNQGQFLLAPILIPGELAGDSRLAWDDSRILNLFMHEVQVVDGPPRAVFLHLFNTHPPYVLDSDCEVLANQDRFGRTGALRQVGCAMSQLVRLMDVLQSKGVYDQTLVIVLGDHGSSSHLAEADLASANLVPGPGMPGTAPRLVGSANPMLLIKPIGSRQVFQELPVFAQLADLPATICAGLGDCSWNSGIDLFSAGTDKQRKRRFMSYIWENRFWGMGYIPVLDFFTVDGPVHNWASWSREERSVSRIQSGRLNFSEQDDPVHFGPGWGIIEHEENRPSKRWAIDREAELFLNLDDENPPGLVWQLNFEVYLPEFIAQQAIGLKVNGVDSGRHELAPGMQVVSFRVPPSALKKGTDTVTLVFDTLIPAAGAESRALALVFTSLTIEKICLGESAEGGGREPPNCSQ